MVSRSERKVERKARKEIDQIRCRKVGYGNGSQEAMGIEKPVRLQYEDPHEMTHNIPVRV